MPVRSVDVIAAGPPSSDPYDAAAPAWALAVGFAARGADVRVLHLGSVTDEGAPPGTTSVPIELSLRRPGAAIEPAEFVAAAGRKVRRDAELIVRDPLGLGRLGVHRSSRGPPIVVGFVRELELTAFERDRAQGSVGGMVGRLDTWRDRRAVRRLEQAALNEVDRLFYDSPELPTVLAREYSVPERRLRPMPPPVVSASDPPARAAARDALRLPLDVPIVAAPASVDRPDPAGIDRCAEAFRRVRPFFPGARLVVVGSSAPADPGIVNVPARDRASFAGALAAADVALFLGRTPGFDPSVILALRAGCLPVVAANVRLPLNPGALVRTLPSEDPGDIASVLAELLADPALRREVLKDAATYADLFLPERAAEDVEKSVTAGAG